MSAIPPVDIEILPAGSSATAKAAERVHAVVQPILLSSSRGVLVFLQTVDELHRFRDRLLSSYGIVASVYHSRLDPLERESTIRSFTADPGPSPGPRVLVSTVALAMGCNLGDLAAVIIGFVPDSPELLCQLIGRGVRSPHGSSCCVHIIANAAQCKRVSEALTENGKAQAEVVTFHDPHGREALERWQASLDAAKLSIEQRRAATSQVLEDHKSCFFRALYRTLGYGETRAPCMRCSRCRSQVSEWLPRLALLTRIPRLKAASQSCSSLRRSL